eukprot:763773-Alexandrium_andersonii.AAC.1
MHILHGVSKLWVEQLPRFKLACQNLTSLAKFLASPDNRQRLKVTCFSDGPLQRCAWLLDKDIPLVVEWIWSSLIATLGAVLPLESLLRS